MSSTEIRFDMIIYIYFFLYRKGFCAFPPEKKSPLSVTLLTVCVIAPDGSFVKRRSCSSEGGVNRMLTSLFNGNPFRMTGIVPRGRGGGLQIFTLIGRARHPVFIISFFFVFTRKPVIDWWFWVSVFAFWSLRFYIFALLMDVKSTVHKVNGFWGGGVETRTAVKPPRGSSVCLQFFFSCSCNRMRGKRHGIRTPYASLSGATSSALRAGSLASVVNSPRPSPWVE